MFMNRSGISVLLMFTGGWACEEAVAEWFGMDAGVCWWIVCMGIYCFILGGWSCILLLFGINDLHNG